MASVHTGPAELAGFRGIVIVIGREHTTSWGPDGSKTYGRVINADSIGADLARAIAEIRRVTRNDTDQ